MCLCGAVNDKEGGVSGGGKVAACDDSKEKVSYGDVWDEAGEELNRKETNQRTSNIFILCA